MPAKTASRLSRGSAPWKMICGMELLRQGLVKVLFEDVEGLKQFLFRHMLAVRRIFSGM